MSQDGFFINKLAIELNNTLKGGRVDNIFDLNKSDYVLDIRVPGNSYYLYMSISYNNPTIFLTKERFEKPNAVSNFTMLLRKYLIGSYIESISELKFDRVVKISFDKRDDLLGNKNISLVLELIGRFSNLLLLSEDDTIIDAIKQLSVLENNSRGIMRGLKYIPLLNDKLSPTDEKEISKIFNNNENLYPKKLVETISGMSPTLAEYLINNYKNSNDNFYDYYQRTVSSYKPTLTSNDFYFFDIFDSSSKEYFNDLSSLLYENYKRNALSKILKDNNHKIYQTVSSNIKRLKKKLINLNEDLKKDLASDDLRIKGELLKANAYIDYPRSSNITLYNYYNNEDLNIPIDPSKSLIDNANIYFKKYKKAKSAIEHLNTQIKLAEDELEYFNLINYQLNDATLKDIKEIESELINNGYIKTKVYPSKKKNNLKPNYLEIKYEGVRILVGKNNLQNEYITHKIARKDDLWFHVKDAHGSHVLVVGENKDNENVIRKAAYLAASYSEAKDSSSVPVDYTLVKYIKKIPGRKGSFVSYTHNKTIYIDPKRED